MGTAAACGIGIGLGDLDGLTKLPAVAAADTELDVTLVRSGSGVEPLVQLLEQTSRDQLIQTIAAKVRTGTSYRELLAALLLAGVRNVQPRPAVGFKFHAFAQAIMKHCRYMWHLVNNSSFCLDY